MSQVDFAVRLLLSPVLEAEDFSDLYESLSRSVVTIHTNVFDAQSRSYQKGLGSGVVVESDKIITAAHVVHTASNKGADRRGAGRTGLRRGGASRREGKGVDGAGSRG